MAKLRTAMDAAFWDLEIATPQTVHGCAKSIPGEPFPLDGSRASSVLRVQQLSIIGEGFPLGLIPSISPPHSRKDLGSFSLQSLFLRQSFGDWWVGLVGQFRPMKVINQIKADFSSNELQMRHAIKDATKCIFDKSLYSLGAYTHIPITSASSLLLSTETHGERKGRRNKVMLYHKLPFHDITLDAAWPELFIDSKGRYWNVPESVSLDLLSAISESGLRYRFGLHKNDGQPWASINSTDTDTPPALLPGLCAKTAFSYEKHKDLWRVKETLDDLVVSTKDGVFRRPAYDLRMKEPHASISAIIGGTCGAWLWGEEKPEKLSSGKCRSPFFADLFGSVCSTVQHGKFRKAFGDLTRFDARLDVCSASAIAKNISSVLRNSSNARPDNSTSLPKLSLIFQQQIAGPIVFRIDSKYMLNPGTPNNALQLEDFMYSLTYSFTLLESGKVVAWYSPKRKEGMVELRIYEF